MADIQGLELAVAREVGMMLHNATFRKPTMAGLLVGLDNYYNVKAGEGRFRPLGVVGGDMQVNLITDTVEWTESDATSSDIESRRVAFDKDYVFKAFKAKAASIKVGQRVDRADINKLKSSKDLSNLVQVVSKLITEGFATKLDKLLFPAVNAVGGAGRKGGDASLMQFSYALQNGYANNDTAGTLNTYDYWGFNLAGHPDVQAVNVGKAGTAWTLTETSLYDDLIVPLRDRGSNIDLLLVGSKSYSYLRAQLIKQVQRDRSDLKYSGEFFTLDGGINVVLETGIDRLPVEELYIGDSSTLRYGISEDADKAVKLIENVPNYPDMHALQGWTQHCFFNEFPRMWGRAYNVTRA